MVLRLFIDPETGRPHIASHRVERHEVLQVLLAPLDTRRGSGDSLLAVGRTDAGRYLRVVYVPDRSAESVFVITAYDLSPKQRTAFRRRMRRKS